MPNYTLNLDRKFTVWQNQSVTVEFDGSEAELRLTIAAAEGDLEAIDALGRFGDEGINYNSHDFLVETEEYIAGQFEIHDIVRDDDFDDEEEESTEETPP